MSNLLTEKDFKEYLKKSDFGENLELISEEKTEIMKQSIYTFKLSQLKYNYSVIFTVYMTSQFNSNEENNLEYKTFKDNEEIGKAEIESGSNLDNSISKLIALAESNPELKANENVNALIIELEGTENRIMVARQDYIKTVTEYNTLLRQFPTSIIAKLFGFKEVQVFQASPEANKVPNVDLK